MNGTRMNQLVAPTSFITSISRRRANMAIRMALRISSSAATSRPAPTTNMARWAKFDTPVTVLTLSLTSLASSTPGSAASCAPMLSMRLISPDAGFTRYESGTRVPLSILVRIASFRSNSRSAT